MANIKDVAKLAGVSVTTVSRVLLYQPDRAGQLASFLGGNNEIY